MEGVDPRDAAALRTGMKSAWSRDRAGRGIRTGMRNGLILAPQGAILRNGLRNGAGSAGLAHPSGCMRAVRRASTGTKTRSTDRTGSSSTAPPCSVTVASSSPSVVNAGRSWVNSSAVRPFMATKVPSSPSRARTSGRACRAGHSTRCHPWGREHTRELLGSATVHGHIVEMKCRHRLREPFRAAQHRLDQMHVEV